MPALKEISSGFFISLNNTETEDLFKFLKENEYTEDKEGLKEFILDSIYGEEGEHEEKPFFSKLAENPDLINAGIQAVSNFLNKKRTPR